MSIDTKFNPPFLEIESILKYLEQSIETPPEKNEKEIAHDVQRINDIVKDKFPQLIEDIAKHPQHAEVWKKISSSLSQIEPHQFEKIQTKVAQMIHIGTALSLPADEAIKLLDADLQKCADALIVNRNVDENLKFIGLILTNYFKLFRGITASDGSQLTDVQKINLNDILIKFEKALILVPKEVRAHPNFENLQRLLHRIGIQHDALEFLTPIPRLNSLKFLPDGIASLTIIRDTISHNPKQGYVALAAWIDYNKIPLCDYQFSEDELKGIQPHLRHVYLRGFDFSDWTEEKILLFLQNFSKMEELWIATNKIKSLPDNLATIKSLKLLDCSGCSSLTRLPMIKTLDETCLLLMQVFNNSASHAGLEGALL